MKGRWVVVLVVIVILLGMYWTRNEVVQLSGVGGFYRINRLTGNTDLIAGVLTQRVKGIRESQIEILRQKELREKAGDQGAPQAPGKK